MSEEAIDGFVPELSSFVKSRFPSLWDWVFPSSSRLRCPAPSYEIDWFEGAAGTTIWWPSLVPLCLWGVWIGITRGRWLLQGRGKRINGHLSFGVAFIWFALMNVCGLWHHCLKIEPDVFRLGDIIGTGCACACLSLGFMCVLGWTDDTKPTFAAVLSLLCGVTACAAIAGPPMLRDAVYVAPMGVAALLGFLTSVKPVEGKNVAQAKAWLHLGFVSFLWAVFALPLDKYLCSYFGPHGLFIVWYYVGSNLAMLFIHMFVLTLHAERPGAIRKLD